MSSSKQGSMGITILLLAVSLILLAIIFLVSESELIKVLTCSLFLVVLASGGVYLVHRHGSRSQQLKKKLERINSLFTSGTMGELKMVYLEIYNLYMKLSEKNKRNFYAKVDSLREKIEGMLQAENKMEELLKKGGSLSERKKNYDQIKELHQKLPTKAQQECYPRMVHFREQLEKGY